MSLPCISVIVPVYNVAKYLQQCIDSLIAQTIADEMEFIFVNDASPDNCLEILRENEKKYPDKIKVIDSKENLYQGGARNLGMRQARGEYIGFVDSDDFVSPTMYEMLYEKAVTSGADATFIQYTSVPEDTINSPAKGGRALIEWEPTLLRLEGKNLKQGKPEEIADFLAYPTGGIYCGLWRKSIILDNGLFFPEHLKYEDNYWGTLIRLYLNKIAFIHEIHYFYRQNPVSTTHSKDPSFLRDRIIIENSLLNEAKKRGFFTLYHDAWEYIYIVRYALNTCMLNLQLCDSIDYELVKKVMGDLETEFPSWRSNKYFQKDLKTQKLKGKILRCLFSMSATLFVKVMHTYFKLKRILRRRK